MVPSRTVTLLSFAQQHSTFPTAATAPESSSLPAQNMQAVITVRTPHDDSPGQHQHSDQSEDDSLDEDKNCRDDRDCAQPRDGRPDETTAARGKQQK